MVLKLDEFIAKLEDGETSRLLRRLAGGTANAAVVQALKEITTREERLTDAENRFRKNGFPEKASGCARARAELMPIRDILRQAAEKEEPHYRPCVAVNCVTIDGLNHLGLEFQDGSRLLIPTRLVQGLHGQTPQVVASAAIDADGLGLRWEELDLDLWVPGLLQGVYGTAAWMDEVGKLAAERQLPQKPSGSPD